MNKYLVFLGYAYEGDSLSSVHDTLRGAYDAIPELYKNPDNRRAYFIITILKPDNSFENIGEDDDRIRALQRDAG